MPRAYVYPRRVIDVRIDGAEDHRIHVGRLVPLEAPTALYTHRRVIGPADVDKAVREVLEVLGRLGIDAVTVFRSRIGGKLGDDARRIEAAVEAAITAAGIPLEVQEPEAAPKKERPAAPPRDPSELPPAAVETSAELAAELGVNSGVSRDTPRSAGATERPAPPPPQGPRIAGIDPGSRWVAVTVAEGSTAPLAYVGSRPFEVGRLIQLSKPKVVKRADGSERRLEHRREISDADMDAVLGDIVRYLHGLGVTHVVVERATHFHSGAKTDGARAAGLARAQWIGGEIAGALRAAEGIKVETVSSAVWRRTLKKGGAWRDGVLANFTGWPVSLPNEHGIDAAGAALYAVAKPAPRAPRAPGAPRPRRERKRTSADAHAARAKARADARTAKGCICQGRRRHSTDCPARILA